ncbi:MAG: PIN domain-containing protein [Bifidobacteriaceae bacterium]|nr:PIN domain-containing protein [Bifidobacteriaceae bacterium]
MRFVDTSILLYAVSTDPAERPKAAVARALLEERDLALSTQVLQEFYVQATRATRPDALSGAQAAALVRSFTRFAVQGSSAGLVLAAISLAQSSQLSLWDAAIIAAAQALGCDELLTDDLNDGQVIGGVQVRNPFPGA